VTLLSHPSEYETGIMQIQKIVIQPLTRRMNTGSPCTDDHKLRTTLTAEVFGR
jgi:hypothetical protein